MVINASEAVKGWRAAAEAAGVSTTHLRRLADQGLIAVETINNESMFKTSDLARVKAGELRVPTEPLPGAEDGPSPALPDGKLISEVFTDLNEGASVIDIVIEYTVMPEVARRLVAEWRALKEIDVTAPSVPREIAEMKAQIADLSQQVQEANNALAALAAAVDDNPLSGVASVYACDACGPGTSPLVPVQCGHCGAEAPWGQPPVE